MRSAMIGSIPEEQSVQERAEQKIRDALLSGDKKRVLQTAERIFADLDTISTVHAQQNCALFLLCLPMRIVTEARAEKHSPFEDHRELVERFLRCGDIHHQKRFLRSLYMDAADAISSRGQMGANPIVERVTNIIRSQFAEQISISGLAKAVHRTPTYLCALFKRQTGKTINEYIARTRMLRAKELLAIPHIKLYDICHQVGYFSPSYFSKLFKKYAMMSPGEYRKAVLKKGV